MLPRSLSPRKVGQESAQARERLVASAAEPQVARLRRVRRGHSSHGQQGFAGPVYTYIKTDYHGNFKWGARHGVGEHFHG